MTTAATRSSMGATNAIFRQTARSCAAPFACHAAHRSSKPGEPPPAVDVFIEGGAAIVGTSVTMCPHASGFGEGLAIEWERCFTRTLVVQPSSRDDTRTQ